MNLLRCFNFVTVITVPKSVELNPIKHIKLDFSSKSTSLHKLPKGYVDEGVSRPKALVDRLVDYYIG